MRRNVPYAHRLGETNTSNDGQIMTIIRYGDSHDIDVRFEDGTIVKHKSYEKFISGYIRNPSLYKNNPEDRIGQNKIANNGMKMTIINYRKADDMDVQFEDGAIVEHTSYGCFKKHDVANPNIDMYDHTYKIGEEHLANCGIKMKIIAYRSCKDIDVEFETGLIRKHTRYHKITNGAVLHDFPYTMKNDINLIRLAYVYNNIANIEYLCPKCHLHDIDTINVIKNHKCEII